MKKKLIATLIGIMLIVNSSGLVFAAMPSSSDLKNVSTSKVWTVTFNDSINQNSAKSYIKVFDDNNKEVEIELSFSNNGKTVEVKSKQRYSYGEKYSLKIDEDLLNTESEKLGRDKTINFEIEEEMQEGDLQRILKIDDMDLNGSTKSITFEDENDKELEAEIDDDDDYYDDLKNGDYEKKDIVLASLKKDKHGDYELVDMKMLFEEDDIEDESVYKLLELNRNDVALGFGRDIDDSVKKYYDDGELDEKYAQRLGLGDLFASYGEPDEGDFVRAYVNKDLKLEAIAYVTDDEDEVKKSQYAEDGLVETGMKSETELIGRVTDIDNGDDEYELELVNQQYDEDDEDEYDVIVKEGIDGYDDLEDDDIENDDIVRVVAEKSGKKYTAKSVEVLIKDRDFDENPLYCVIDNDDDEIELGYGEDVDTDPDDYDKDNISKFDKARNIAEIRFQGREIDEGDFVQVHVNENDKIDAISLAYPTYGNKDPDEDYYADNEPTSSMSDVKDGSVVLIDDIVTSGKRTYVEVIGSSGRKHKVETTDDAEDMIEKSKVHEGDFVEIDYDDDDDEITDFEVVIDRNEDVYKVIDIDSDEVELGYDNDPDTDTDDFGSKDKITLDKAKKMVEFGKVKEGDFVKVSVDDDEIEVLAEVDEPKELADSKPGEASNKEMMVLVTDIRKKNGDYIVTVEDEDEKEYELTAIDDAEDDLEKDRLEEDSVINMTWDEDEDEISDFDVLIDEDDEDDVYKVIEINKDSLELGFDDSPRTDTDDFSKSDKDEVDMDRSAEIFGDLDEGDFVRLYLDDDEIKAVKVVSRPDELADESPVD